MTQGRPRQPALGAVLLTSSLVTVLCVHRLEGKSQQHWSWKLELLSMIKNPKDVHQDKANATTLFWTLLVFIILNKST